MGEIPDAHEIRELEEHAENVRNRRIGLLISILAIALAICGALGRKAENSVIVARVDASNTWSYFQAKKLRGFQSETTVDLAKALAPARGAEVAEHYAGLKKKYEAESEKISEEAKHHEEQAEKWELRANRFSLGEIFLQIAVVLCSIAILTEAQAFVYVGLTFASVGIAFAFSVIAIH